MSEWLPALDGVVERLKHGARVADIGCGHGASTIVMAQAFPKSSFIGPDYHDASIATARERAAEQGVTGNIAFEVKTATEFDGHDFDLICFMDCPCTILPAIRSGALAEQVRKALRKPDGKVLLVEPYAGDRLEENLNPIGRMYYAASAAWHVHAELLSQEVGLGLVVAAGGRRTPAQGGARSRVFQPAARRADPGQPDPRTDPLSGNFRKCKSSAQHHGG